MSYIIQSKSNIIDFSAWDSFVEKQSLGTVFQSSDMHRLFLDSENFEPVPIMICNEKGIMGVLLAVIIKEYPGKIGFLSSRTVVYGGPVIDENSDKKREILDLLLKELIRKVRNRTVFIQFRNFFDFSDGMEIFEKNGFNYLERLNYLVDTTDDSVVKKNISSSKLRQVKKGLESGAEIIDPENVDQVKEFYNILFNHYKTKVKKPLPKWSFFENFYHLAKDGKLGMIKLVRYKNRIIGGILSPVFNSKVIYEWYVCGLDQEYKKLYPSVLATWSAIEYALQNRIKSFDFMGVGVPDKEYGVRDFKAKFGGELVNYGRYGRINNQFIYLLTEIGFNILSMLKKI